MPSSCGSLSMATAHESFSPGHSSSDAQPPRAGREAAVGQCPVDAHFAHANGGTISKFLPATRPLMPSLRMPGESAAVSQIAPDAHFMSADGGTITLTEGTKFVLDQTAQDHLAACAEIIQHGRRRRYAMGVQQKLDRSLEAFVRRQFTEWNPDDDEKTREKHNAETVRLIADARGGKGRKKTKPKGPPLLLALVTANDTSRSVYDTMRAAAEKEMIALAAKLPVAPWVASIRGAGWLGLASIIAETGPLDNYAGPAKLWSRLGFAPFEGAAMSTYMRPLWRPRALTDDEWIDHPFSPKRYAHMAMLAKPLRDLNWIGAKKTPDGKGKPNGYYGQVYADRRAHTDLTHPEWTDQHRDRDALRVMFKRFLADLWTAWRDTSFVSGQASRDAHDLVAGDEKTAAGHLELDAQSVGAGGGH